MRVRAPREDDAEALARLHERCWRISYAGLADPSWIAERPWEERLAQWRGFCRGDGLPMWVAEAGGAPVGFVAAGTSRDEDAGADTAEVAALYVDPDHQRRGAGAALLRVAEDALRADGFARATLWTLAGNPGSRAFYERCGWRVEAARKDEGLSAEGEIRYEKAL